MTKYYTEKKTVDMMRVGQIPDIIATSGFASKLIDEYLDMFKDMKSKGSDNGVIFNTFMEYLNANDIDMYQRIAEKAIPSPMLYFVKADYGYCVTTHKSQGSEYPKVCYLLEKFDKPLLYTGLSRAKTDLMIINLTKTR